MIIDFNTVTAFLNRKHVKLRPPASRANFSRIQEIINGSIDNNIYEMYSIFDGFEELDFEPASFIRIWSLDEVVKNNDLSSSPRLFFSDTDLMAIWYSVDFSDSSRQIFNDNEVALASDLSSFWKMIISERFFPA